MKDVMKGYGKDYERLWEKIMKGFEKVYKRL